jgi:PAS domain S-box-containing protein
VDNKILLPLLGAMLSVIVVSIINYRNLDSLDRAQTAAATTQSITGGLGDLLSTLQDLETGVRGYVITGSAAYLAPYSTALARVEEVYATLERLIPNLPGEQARLPELRAAVDRKVAATAEIVQIRSQQGFEAAQSLIATDRGRAEMDAIRVILSRMETNALRQLTNRLGELDSVSRRAQAFVMYSLLAMAVIFLLLALLIARVLRARDDSAREIFRQRELLHTTIRSIGDAMIATDPARHVTLMNEQAEQLTGWSAADATGRPITEIMAIVNEKTRHSVENPVERCLIENRVVGLANHSVLIARGGREIPIDDSAAPIRGPKGEVHGAVIVFRDVTARKQMEDELRSQAARLSEVARQKDEFLAVLAHELRNPLAPITNSLAIVQQSTEPGTVRKAIDIIQRQTTQLNRLVDDLLDMGRINTGRLELRMAVVDLGSIVDQAVEMIRPKAEKRSQMISVSLPSTPLTVYGDDARLAQVIGNLLDNASKYSDTGSAIELAVEADAEGVVIAVRDRGAGIAADQISRVFQMFSQVHDHHRNEGLGIGLALVQRLVELHGGTVEARSEGLGCGSEFLVRLPNTHRLAAASTVERDDAPIPPRRVLVVDDNTDAASTLVHLLESAGHSARAAHSGHDALLLAATFEVDIVFLDIGMPGMNGFEVCRAIRAAPWGARVAVYALTGWGQNEDRAKTRAAGFDGHLIKPVSPRTIATVLRDAPASAAGA